MAFQTAQCHRMGVQDTQPPELVVRDKHGVMSDFLCNEDRDLWKSVDPKNELGTYKHLTSLKNKLHEKFGSLQKFDHLWKILSRFLEGQNKEYLVEGLLSVHGFVEVTNWFGSFKLIPGDDANNCYCLQQIGKLMEKGGKKNDNSFKSWFAGFMTSDEAQEKIIEKKCGTFLVRFSESFKKEGGFALAVKGKGEKEVLHYHLKGDLAQACSGHFYNARLKLFSDSREVPELGPFQDVVELVKKLENEKIDGVRLEKICPDLPLNATFQGYR